MILDSLENSATYGGVSLRLKQTFEYLAATDLKALAPGRYEIDGEKIFVKVMEGDLRQEEDALLEVHDKYIDVQVLVSGNVEKIGWRERRECREPRGSFDGQEDILFFEDRSQSFFEIKPGQFVVFWPEDAHAPMIGNGRVKKVVVKVMR